MGHIMDVGEAVEAKVRGLAPFYYDLGGPSRDVIIFEIPEVIWIRPRIRIPRDFMFVGMIGAVVLGVRPVRERWEREDLH